MNKKKRLPLLLFLLLLGEGIVYAGGVGTTRANFLKIMPGARAVAMGGAFGAISDDIYAVHWNPAGLTLLKQKEFSFTHLQWLEGIKYNWIGYGFSLSKGKIIGLDKELETTWVDNFDDGVHPNMVGGEIEIWGDRGQGGSSRIQADYYEENEGYSYKVSYNISGYGGLWMGLNNLNIQMRQVLSFMVKGTRGNEIFEVGLKDMQGIEIKVDVRKYKKVTKKWERIIIPIDDFQGVDLANLDNVSFSFRSSGKVYIDEIKFTGRRIPRKMLAVTAAYLTSGNMVHYEETSILPYYEEKETFSANQSIITFSYAGDYTIRDLKIPIGFNLKILREKLYTDNPESWGLAVDCGALYNFSAHWGKILLGLTLQNMGYITPIEKDTSALPFNIKTSVGIFSRSYPVAVDIDIDSPIDNRSKLSLGLETWYKNMLFGRVGYSFGQDMGGLGAGLGFRMKGVQIDYAFAPYSLLGNTHRVSLSYKFGKL